MTPVPDRNTFESAYAGQPPWDIGRPQKAFLDVADQITGSILDAGCGTGENALFFASRGQKVTGIDFLKVPIQRAKKKAAGRGVSISACLVAIPVDQRGLLIGPRFEDYRAVMDAVGEGPDIAGPDQLGHFVRWTTFLVPRQGPQIGNTRREEVGRPTSTWLPSDFTTGSFIQRPVKPGH